MHHLASVTAFLSSLNVGIWLLIEVDGELCRFLSSIIPGWSLWNQRNGRCLENKSTLSVDVSESNEIEVFAMLVGCRELRRLGGHNAIIEVDSFSAIQCGSGNACYPWRLVDWVEEI